ncbi:MAG: L-serine ammonia-lyase, iron-sulfur-dependent subunit beta [Bacillota bacterium]|jgi:L-serine dehydratase
MPEVGLFDIIGPVMIGPSSSHTAGAARIGFIARLLAGEKINSVLFRLHGSFAKTQSGHGTDKALLAGVLGLKPSDERLKDAYELADQAGLDYRFICVDLGDVHPNSVEIVVDGTEGEISIVGCSLGGGVIKITQINDNPVDFSGDYPTLITLHDDQPGVLAKITELVADYGVNVASMRVFRNRRFDQAMMVLETDETIPSAALEKITDLSFIYQLFVVDAISL